MGTGKRITINLLFAFYTLTLGDNFLIINFRKCVCNESCSQELAPTSPNSSSIQNVAISAVNIKAFVAKPI